MFTGRKLSILFHKPTLKDRFVKVLFSYIWMTPGYVFEEAQTKCVHAFSCRNATPTRLCRSLPFASSMSKIRVSPAPSFERAHIDIEKSSMSLRHWSGIENLSPPLKRAHVGTGQLCSSGRAPPEKDTKKPKKSSFSNGNIATRDFQFSFILHLARHKVLPFKKPRTICNISFRTERWVRKHSANDQKGAFK